MKRLIDADALYEQIAKKEKLAQQRVLDTPSMMPNGNLNPSAIRYTAQLDERTQMKCMIADAPTIDAEPVRHGKWECTYLPNGFLLEQTCSECGLTFEEPSGVDYNYCPQCGCRMDEE